MTFKIKTLFAFLVIIMNTSICFASENVIPSGEVIFLDIKLANPYVCDELSETDLQIGDIIIEIKDSSNKKYDIKNVKEIYKSNSDLQISIKRENKICSIKMNSLDFRKAILRDSMYSIATLTYIDPVTKEFKGVAHNCQIEANDVEMKNGYIYLTDYVQCGKNKISKISAKNTEISSLYTSPIGKPIGTINNMGSAGISGRLMDLNLLKSKTIQTAKAKEGRAYILTEHPITNEIVPMEINIKEVGKTHCEFEVIDKDLLDIRNGIVRGMSGSPIIQENKLVGAISHSIKKKAGAGLFLNIEYMIK